MREQTNMEFFFFTTSGPSCCPMVDDVSRSLVNILKVLLRSFSYFTQPNVLLIFCFSVKQTKKRECLREKEK